MDLVKSVVDNKIFGHFPSFLLRSPVDRSRTSTDTQEIYMWQALCLVRQIVTQNYALGRDRLAPDAGWTFYNTLAMGGQAYLDDNLVNQFHQAFSIDPEARALFSQHVETLKEDMKLLVSGLMQVRTHIRPQGWLVCAVVEMQDLPWLIEDAANAQGNQTTSSMEDTMH